MSLYTDHSLVQAVGLLDNLTLFKLKVWWKGLSTEEQEALCRVDSEDIVSAIVNAANKALYLCRMNQAYKKKDLMSKHAIKDQNGEASGQMVEFNLVGKDIAKDDWENLFSCFYLSVSQGQKAKESDFNIIDMQKNYSGSHISVKRDKLGVILDLLASSVRSFGQGDKPVYEEQTLSKLFPSILGHSSQIRISILDLKPDLKALFENLMTVAIIIEHQIYLGYFKKTHPSTSNISGQAVVDQFNSLSAQFELAGGKISTPLMIKTVSQLERESGKPCQSLSAKSALDNSPCSSQREESASSSSTRSKLSEELPHMQFYEERNSVYDGFIMDDLAVGFESFDILLTNEKFLDASEEEQEEIIERKNTRVVKDEQDQISDDEGSLSQSSADSFYEQSAATRINAVPWPIHQAYFPQPNHPMPMQPVNFGMPMTPFNHPNEYMMTNFNSHYPPQGYQDHNNFSESADIRIQRKRSFESQSSQSSDREYFPMQSFQQFSNGSPVENKTKTRHYSRPQLPPRLQKKKEHMLRN